MLKSNIDYFSLLAQVCIVSSHARTHARTYARTHARTHARTSIHEVVGSSPTRRSNFSNLNLYNSPYARA